MIVVGWIHESIPGKGDEKMDHPRPGTS